MQRIKRFRLPIVLAIIGLVAAAAGLYAAGVIKTSAKPEKKEPVVAIGLTDPFIINLADYESDAPHYVKMSVSLQLEPMTKEEHAAFVAPRAGDGGKGGSAEEQLNGSQWLAQDPALRDAVIDVVSRMSSDELVKPDGKRKLKELLLQRFDVVAESATPMPLGGDPKKPDPARPPFHIQDVYLRDFAVQ